MKQSNIVVMTQEDLDKFGDDLTEKFLSRLPKPQIVQTVQEQPNYLTRKETAAKLKCSYPKLWALTKDGHIHAYRLGRKVLYRSEDVDGMIQKLNLKPQSMLNPKMKKNEH